MKCKPFPRFKNCQTVANRFPKVIEIIVAKPSNRHEPPRQSVAKSHCFRGLNQKHFIARAFRYYPPTGSTAPPPASVDLGTSFLHAQNVMPETEIHFSRGGSLVRAKDLEVCRIACGHRKVREWTGEHAHMPPRRCHVHRRR